MTEPTNPLAGYEAMWAERDREMFARVARLFTHSDEHERDPNCRADEIAGEEAS